MRRPQAGGVRAVKRPRRAPSPRSTRMPGQTCGARTASWCRTASPHPSLPRRLQGCPGKNRGFVFPRNSSPRTTFLNPLPSPAGGRGRGEGGPMRQFAASPTSPSHPHPSLPRERGKVGEGAVPSLSPRKRAERAIFDRDRVAEAAMVCRRSVSASSSIAIRLSSPSHATIPFPLALPVEARKRIGSRPFSISSPREPSPRRGPRTPSGLWRAHRCGGATARARLCSPARCGLRAPAG